MTTTLVLNLGLKNYAESNYTIKSTQSLRRTVRSEQQARYHAF